MKKVLLFTVLFVMIICATGCKEGSDKKVVSIDDIIASDNYIIVDVRTEEEFNEGHVVGAINIPYDTIDENTDLDKNKTIVVYCRSGKRSSIAYNTLKDLNYDVFDLGAYDSIDLDKE